MNHFVTHFVTHFMKHFMQHFMKQGWRSEEGRKISILAARFRV